MPKDEPPQKSLMDKLGVKTGARVSVLGVADAAFRGDLRARGADVSARRRKGTDLVFLALKGPGDLGKLGTLERWMTRNGAVWVVYPRGRRDLREVDVIAAGLAAGLVDNKIARFSDTRTSMRFVIPAARR